MSAVLNCLNFLCRSSAVTGQVNPTPQKRERKKKKFGELNLFDLFQVTVLKEVKKKTFTIWVLSMYTEIIQLPTK